MSGVKKAFKFLDKHLKAPHGFKRINYRIIFEVKMNLTRKAHFEAGGHITATPTVMMCTSVVSRKSVRITLLLASLNDVDLLDDNITLAYLNAPTKKFVLCCLR